MVDVHHLKCDGQPCKRSRKLVKTLIKSILYSGTIGKISASDNKVSSLIPALLTFEYQLCNIFFLAFHPSGQCK